VILALPACVDERQRLRPLRATTGGFRVVPMTVQGWLPTRVGSSDWLGVSEFAKNSQTRRTIRLLV